MSTTERNPSAVGTSPCGNPLSVAIHKLSRQFNISCFVSMASGKVGIFTCTTSGNYEKRTKVGGNLFWTIHLDTFFSCGLSIIRAAVIRPQGGVHSKNSCTVMHKQPSADAQQQNIAQHAVEKQYIYIYI